MADLGQRPVSRRTLLKGGAAVAALGGVSAFIAACGSSTASTAPTAAAATAASVAARPRRRSRRPWRPTAPAPSAGGTVTLRLELLRRRAEEGHRRRSSTPSQRRRASRSRSTPSTTTRSRTDQHVPAGHAGRRRSPGSPATGCGSSPPRASPPTSTTCGPTIGGNFSDAFKTASTGDDGKQYFVPIYNYPWVGHLPEEPLRGRRATPIPKTLDEFKALGDKMKTDGLIPIAFGDKDGWPAMGTFDILNMRMNGYEFHVDLMAGKEKWTDPKVKAVFEQWAELLPYFQDRAPLGRTWQEAAQAAGRQEGRHVLPGHVRRASRPTDAAVHDDLDFFPFPILGTAVRRRDGHRRPDRRLHDVRQGPRTSTAPRRSSSASARPRGADHLPRLEPERRRGRQRRRHEQATPPFQKKSADDHRGARARSPSSSTATPGRTSRARTACRRFLQTFLERPDPGPRQVPERHPGVLRQPAAAVIRIA